MKQLQSSVEFPFSVSYLIEALAEKGKSYKLSLYIGFISLFKHINTPFFNCTSVSKACNTFVHAYIFVMYIYCEEK